MTMFDFIAKKRTDQATIMETIKAVMIEFGVPLSEAKELVSSHPSWLKTVDAVRPLHSDLDTQEGMKKESEY